VAIKLLKAFRPDGTVRAVWSDTVADSFRAAGALPQRASRVEVIPDGRHRGFFHVDFSLLADITGEPCHRVCLVRPFASYAEAVAAEVRWLELNWVVGGPYADTVARRLQIEVGALPP
jgi:hypothetical protein